MCISEVAVPSILYSFPKEPDREYRNHLHNLNAQRLAYGNHGEAGDSPLCKGRGSDIQADWNFAIEKAEGEFVTIAHQDDMYGKHYVEELKKSYERWPDMTVFMTDAVTIKNGNVQRWSLKELVKKTLRLPLRFHGLADREAVKKSGLLLGNPVMCPSCAYRKNYLPDPIFHSEYRYALDWDCMVDLAKWPGRFVCVEKPLLYYRIHDGAATKVCIENHRRETEERQMFERFWPEPVVEFLMKFYKKASQEW